MAKRVAKQEARPEAQEVDPVEAMAKMANTIAAGVVWGEPVEADGAGVAGGLRVIPLDRLMLSDLNVRQTERDADIASLAEDIAARGLKQNLVVVPSGEFASATMEPETAIFEVIAGGRRFQAMQLLVEDGRLPADHGVPCLVEHRDDARETSLSENLHRVAINPADEFEAFRAIVEGASRFAGSAEADRIAYCAKRFGVTVRHVEGRMRLADLAPEILEALRGNVIGIEAAKAYATVPDHKLQLTVFKAEQKRSYGDKHAARFVRDALRGKTYPADCVQLRYVGRDAYLAAGGRIAAELFMGEAGAERLIDPAIADRLALAKAEAEVEAIAKADGWKSGVVCKPINDYYGNRVKPPEGMTSAWNNGEVAKTVKKKSIGIYRLGDDGDAPALELTRYYLTPAKAEKKDDGYRAPTPEEIAAQRRQERITMRAARLAVPKFAGTPHEGMAFWPPQGRWIDAISRPDDDHLMVAVQIRVPIEAVEAQMAAAELEIDAEEEAKREADAAAAAAREARDAQLDDEGDDDGYEPGDDDDDDDDPGLDDVVGEFDDDDEDHFSGYAETVEDDVVAQLQALDDAEAAIEQGEAEVPA